MSLNIKYPIWFPYPSSWMRSLIPLLLFPLLFTGAGFLGYVIFMLSILLGISSIPILIISPIIVITLLHHVLFGKGKNLIPLVVSMWEGIYAFQVFMMTILIVFLTVGYSSAILTPHPEATFTHLQDYRDFMPRSSSDIYTDELLAIVFFFYCWTVSASLYQIEYLARKAIRKIKKETQIKNMTSKALKSQH
ncbi:MAG: hypothetical protein AB4042_16325 [Leptolyngbyaceae cyanobacterium]